VTAVATAVGVPLRIPVLVFRDKPAGSAGLTAYEVMLPPLLAGLFGVMATPLT
jgi:hypothetical protein